MSERRNAALSSFRLLTVSEASDRLGCAPAVIHRLIAMGKLRHFRFGPRGRPRFLNEWLVGVDTTLPSFSPTPPKPRLKLQHIGDLVYFVEAPLARLIKIGWSANFGGRIEELRIYSPVPLKVLGCVPGNLLLERELHARFTKERKHGEWFRASGRLREFIAETVAERGVELVYA